MAARDLISIDASSLGRVTGGVGTGPGRIVQRRLVNEKGEVVGAMFHLERALVAGVKHAGFIMGPDGKWMKVFNSYLPGR